MPRPRLTAAEWRLIVLALELGAQWEETLVDSLTPRYSKPDRETRAYIRKTESNARRMRSLKAKMTGRSEGAATKGQD